MGKTGSKYNHSRWFGKTTEGLFAQDLSDTQTFDLAKQVLKELISEQFLKNLPFAILCNKSDIAQKCDKENLKIVFDFDYNNVYKIFITCAIKGKV